MIDEKIISIYCDYPWTIVSFEKNNWIPVSQNSQCHVLNKYIHQESASVYPVSIVYQFIPVYRHDEDGFSALLVATRLESLISNFAS